MNKKNIIINVLKGLCIIISIMIVSSCPKIVYGKNIVNTEVSKVTLITAKELAMNINKSNITIEAGGKATLTLSNIPADATMQNWYSTKKSIATVSTKGTVTGKSEGVAYIKRKVTLKDGTEKIFSCKVTVKTKPTTAPKPTQGAINIAINKTKVTIDLSKSATTELSITGLPNGYMVRWQTDDEDVVRLSAYAGQNITIKGLISFNCKVLAHVFTPEGKLYKTYTCNVEVFGESKGNTGNNNGSSNVSESALKKARVNLDYSVVSAKDILRYYTDIGKEGTSLGETEAECQQVLKKVDEMIDKLYDIQGWDIKTPYELAEYLTSLMSTGGISASSNKDGTDAWYNKDLSLPYRITMTNSSSKTGTGKYFKESIINGASDCWGVVVSTELIINRAAERKGYSEEQLKAEYVRQGSDHAINIITVKSTVDSKKYYFAYGINVNTSKVTNWRTSGASGSKDILGQVGGGTFHCYSITNGKLNRVDSLYYITLSSESQSKILTMNPEESVLRYGDGIREESFTVPSSVAIFTCGNNSYLKNLTLNKNVRSISVANCNKLTTISFNGANNVDCSGFNSESPYVKNQASKNGYFAVPEQIQFGLSLQLLSNTIKIDEDTLENTYNGPKWKIKSSHVCAIANAKYNSIPYELY